MENNENQYRAMVHGIYWYICISGTTAFVESDIELHHAIDNLRYKDGNYYAYPSACRRVAEDLNKKIKEIIKESKKM